MATTVITEASDQVTVPAADLWIIRGHRYDLRSFVAQHPGGAHAIGLGQGRDCTELFESYHPFTSKPQAVLAQYRYNGPASGDVSSVFKRENPFYDDAKAAVQKYFSPNGNETPAEVTANSKATTAAWIETVVGLALTAFSFWRWCHGDVSAVFYFPLVYFVVCSDLMHTCGHFALSTSPVVNRLFANFGVFHVQYHLWAHQHVVAHHVHTNMNGLDPDMHHFDAVAERSDGGHLGYRSHPQHPKYQQYQWCWKFGVLHQAMGTTAAIAMLNCPKYIYHRCVQVVSFPRRYVAHMALDRAVLLLFVVAFVHHQGLIRGLSLVLPSYCIHGVLFNVFSQITHVNEPSMGQPCKKIEWAEHQIRTGTDYDCDSRLMSLFAINLNNQICHHLFPSVHPCHYAALRRVLLPVAAKHNIDYEKRSGYSFPDVLRNYFSWLRQLNSGKTSGEAWQANLYGFMLGGLWAGGMIIGPLIHLTTVQA